MKKLLSLLLATMMIIGVPSMAFADNVSQIIGDGNTVVFIDVPANYWAKDQIEYFANQGIVDGYTDGSFKPEAGVTREEFCKLLVSTFKQPLETPATPTFADVAENRWSYPYVEVCRDFLTGYANPFGGLPSFHPTEYATREDIAVALVRMMGFTDKDASNPNYAAYNFRDGGSISPNILAYVSIACERGLISGYPDGTFGPTKGITRAETVVLLNRATKQAVTNINSELEISANVIYSSDKKTATINIVAEEGTTVTVNGESVKMSSNYYGEYEGNYVYKFEAEGSKDFAVEGKRAGKTKTINVSAKYEIGAPTLTLTQSNTTVTSKDFRLSGSVNDENEKVSVTINGEDSGRGMYSRSYSWSKDFTLKEGANVFTVIATNESGKSTTKEITITYTVGAPELSVTQSNTTVTSKDFRLSGSVSDDNYKVSVTINGEDSGRGMYSRSYSWSKDFTLKEGENVFTVVATNENGKSATKEITITYTVGAPELSVTQNNTTVSSKDFRLSGSVSDENYKVSVTINGADSGRGLYGRSYSWSKDFTLKEGENVFTVVATNESGKSTTKEITIKFVVSAPEIQFINCPETTTKNEITIKGKIQGGNEGAMLFVNDEEVRVSYNGDFSTTVKLKEGKNTFKFRAVNNYGKEDTITKTITYTPESDVTEE